MSFSYSLKEGLAGFRRARFAVVASTSAMTVALVLIGLFALVGYQGKRVSDWLHLRVGEVELMLVQNATETEATTIERRAAQRPGVAETDYISPEEAQTLFARDFGEGADIFFDEPFLPASIRVRVQPAYANPDSLGQLVEAFASWEHVDEVLYNQPLLVKVQRNLRLLSITGLALGALLVLGALFLVANTIRLTIYARRLLIRTMKLVGATDRFICRPFLIEGTVQGIIAGALAALVLWGLYRLAASYLPQLAFQGLDRGLSLAAALVLAGAALGWVGSYFAVRRFIRKVAVH